MAARKKKCRVKVSTRPDQMTDGEALIAEVTALRSGAGCLVNVKAPRDGKCLYISPYRGDGDVYLEIRSHAADCALGGKGKGLSQRDSDAERCDCGACLRYDAATFAWVPMGPKVQP